MSLNKKHNSKLFHGIERVQTPKGESHKCSSHLLKADSSLLSSNAFFSVQNAGNYTVYHLLHIIAPVQLLCRSHCMQIKVFLNGFRCPAIDGSVPVLNIFGKNDNILLRVFDNDST